MRLKIGVLYVLVLVNTVLLIWLFFKPGQDVITANSRYVLNQKIFEDFAGTKEVMERLDKLEKRQKEVLDSMNVEIIALERFSGTDPLLIQKKKQLYQNLHEEFVSGNEHEREVYIREIWMQINQYVQDYGREKGYDMIWGGNGTGSLMYGKASLDVSDDVVRYINRRYAGH